MLSPWMWSLKYFTRFLARKLSAWVTGIMSFIQEKANPCVVWFGTFQERYLMFGTIFDVWVLSDPMRGEWRKLRQIDFDNVQRCRLSCLFKGLLTTRRYRGPYFTPVAWANNGGVVVVFSVEAKTGPYIALNVETRETFAFGRSEHECRYCFWKDYAQSLVSLTPS